MVLEINDIDNNIVEFLEICNKLYNRKYVVGSGGNVSIKLNNKIYITPTGKCLGFLNKNDIAIIDLENNKIIGNPTSELQMHLKIYENRDDIKAIVHTHSIYSTALPIANKEIKLLTPESKIFLKELSYVNYFKAGSIELANEVSKKKNDVIILKNHGIVCLGKNLMEAYLKTEVMEETSKLNYIIYSL